MDTGMLKTDVQIIENWQCLGFYPPSSLRWFRKTFDGQSKDLIGYGKLYQSVSHLRNELQPEAPNI